MNSTEWKTVEIVSNKTGFFYKTSFFGKIRLPDIINYYVDWNKVDNHVDVVGLYLLCLCPTPGCLNRMAFDTSSCLHPTMDALSAGWRNR